MNLNTVIEEHREVVVSTFCKKNLMLLEKIGETCNQIISNGGKLVIFGNGGSAADSQHIAAEFISKLKDDRVPLPAMALTVDTSALTAIANDYGFEHVFSRQIQAICNSNDLVIGISTSGSSKNVIEGLRLAKDIGCLTVALTGSSGILDVNVDFLMKVESSNTARIQEMHILMGHIICQVAESTYVN
jgi:D-sedoheptulose 7-phosphate isomerase